MRKVFRCIYMRNKKLSLGVCALAISIAIASFSLPTEAGGKFTQLPAAGAAIDMGDGSSYIDVQASIESIIKENLSYATGVSSVGLQTIQNDLSVVRAQEPVAEIVSEPVLLAEAAYTVVQQPVIQPITVDTVQEIASEPATEVATSTTPVVITADVTVSEVVEASSEVAEPVEVSEADGDVAVAEEIVAEAQIIPTEELEIPGANVAVKEVIPAEFENLVIAQVNDYINVRAEANTESEIVGKLYDESVGTLVKEEDGWYQITSGNVTGYVKAEFCVVGEEAIALAEEVGTQIATVNTTTLKVRSEADLEASVIGLVPLGEELVVVKEEESVEGWVKVSIEEGEGYVSTEYVSLRTDFVEAESREEEQQRLAAEAAARAEAQRAAQQAITSTSNSTTTVPTITGDSEMGVAVAEYACQFVGNPYVWGGTSLTNGADCSGFVMSVYANFGVSLPHSSTADRTQGYAVDSLENAQPGDLICYSGHVALYIGNGQIVHASSSKTGIIISNADYKKILAIRRIF